MPRTSSTSARWPSRCSGPELSASLGADRFLREIRVAANLQHPNILGLYDSGEMDGLLYYVMPFIEGESLRDRLNKEQQLPLTDALQIARESADALQYAHERGIVHRDIKPENILLMGGHALVADFGIARAVSQAGGEKLTQTGMAIGTPHYMSPEQSLGSEHVDARSDIYSLGCVLYELLIGQPPFTGPNSMAIMARHSMEVVPSLQVVRASIPDEVEDAVMQALEKTPADRFQTMKEFGERLSEAEAEAAMMRTAQRRASTAARRAASGPRAAATPRRKIAGGRRRLRRDAARNSGRSWRPRQSWSRQASASACGSSPTVNLPPAAVARDDTLDPTPHRGAVFRAAGRHGFPGLSVGRSHGSADPRAEQRRRAAGDLEQRRTALQEGRHAAHQDRAGPEGRHGRAGRRRASRATSCG